MVFHQDGPTYHYVDLVRLKEQQAFPGVQLQLHYAHNLALSFQRKTGEERGIPESFEYCSATLIEPFGVLVT